MSVCWLFLFMWPFLTADPFVLSKTGVTNNINNGPAASRCASEGSAIVHKTYLHCVVSTSVGLHLQMLCHINLQFIDVRKKYIYKIYTSPYCFTNKLLLCALKWTTDYVLRQEAAGAGLFRGSSCKRGTRTGRTHQHTFFPGNSSGGSGGCSSVPSGRISKSFTVSDAAVNSAFGSVVILP